MRYTFICTKIAIMHINYLILGNSLYVSDNYFFFWFIDDRYETVKQVKKAKFYAVALPKSAFETESKFYFYVWVKTIIDNDNLKQIYSQNILAPNVSNESSSGDLHDFSREKSTYNIATLNWIQFCIISRKPKE